MCIITRGKWYLQCGTRRCDHIALGSATHRRAARFDSTYASSSIQFCRSPGLHPLLVDCFESKDQIRTWLCAEVLKHSSATQLHAGREWQSARPIGDLSRVR